MYHCYILPTLLKTAESHHAIAFFRDASSQEITLLKTSLSFSYKHTCFIIQKCFIRYTYLMLKYGGILFINC